VPSELAAAEQGGSRGGGALLSPLALLCHHPALTGQGMGGSSRGSSGGNLKPAQALWRRFATRAAGCSFASGRDPAAAAALLGGGAGSAVALGVAAALASDLAGERAAGLGLAASLAEADVGSHDDDDDDEDDEEDDDEEGEAGEDGGAAWRLPGGLAAARLLERRVVPALLAALRVSGGALRAVTGDQWALLDVPDGTLLRDARNAAGAAAGTGKGAAAAERSGGGAASAAPAAAPAPAAAAKRAAPVAKTKGGDFGAAQDDLAWEEQVGGARALLSPLSSLLLLFLLFSNVFFCVSGAS
jgi:hypothetical protein